MSSLSASKELRESIPDLSGPLRRPDPNPVHWSSASATTTDDHKPSSQSLSSGQWLPRSITTLSSLSMGAFHFCSRIQGASRFHFDNRWLGRHTGVTVHSDLWSQVDTEVSQPNPSFVKGQASYSQTDV